MPFSLDDYPFIPMQITMLLQSVCRDIERIYRKFIWEDSSEKKKIHLIKWEFYQPKTNGVQLSAICIL